MIDPLRDRESFARLRRDGHRFSAGPLWCTVVLDPALPRARVGYAIGRRMGNAVTRNRLRRRLRALLAERDVPPGLYLFGARDHRDRPIGEHTYDSLRQAIDRLLLLVQHQSPAGPMTPSVAP